MLPHLVRRFFESLRYRPLGPAEQRVCAGLLRASESPVFWAQQPVDQRHAYEAARTCLASAPDRRDLARAALLHDIGKRHARLSTPGRVLASLARIARMPVRGRMRRYLDHGSIGAAELEDLGCESLVVAFAAAHHDLSPPDGIAPDDWAVLRRADGE